MKKILTLVAAALLALPSAAAPRRPKLVVGLVVDQMRWDYLYYYYGQYRADGLRRLVDEGYSYENTLINYVPTVTAVGHSSVYTGSVPAFTGIAGNNFLKDGKPVYCCDDSTVTSVGSNSKEGCMSPRNLWASGIGDELRLATNFKGKVVGVALKDRAAILPAGHAANAAYWWDTSAGHFISSTYYMKQLPDWVRRLNKKVQVKPGTSVKTSLQGVDKTFAMAEAAIEGEQLGQDSITDLLAVSVSSTDAIGHAYGTRGQMNHDVYMELDAQLAGFLNFLDQKVGKGNYLLFLTADHGAAHNHNFLKEHHMPAGGLNTWGSDSWLNTRMALLRQVTGVDHLVKYVDSGRIYLDHDAIAQAGKSLDEVKRQMIGVLEKDSNIVYVVDYDKVLTTSLPATLREQIVNGYNKKRSGDLFYVPKPEWEDVDAKAAYTGTSHGLWNPCDAHIPFVLFGWHVQHGRSSRQAHIVDIAPTVCDMLYIQMPDCCIGHSLVK